MRLSSKFKNTVKLSDKKKYELALRVGLTQVVFSQYLNDSRKIIGDKEKLAEIGKIINLKEEECFSNA